MLSKDKAFAMTKEAQLKVIEDQIEGAISKGEFETEILNLTEEEQGILKDAGFLLTYTGTKQGYVWKINWE